MLLILCSIAKETIFAQSSVSFSKNITTKKLYINPEYARGGLDSTIFRSVTFIPLETTKESIFGKIYKMEVTGDYFILSDQNTSSILIFDKKGKFKTKIDGRKFEKGMSVDFTVDHEQRHIITRSFKTLLRFNFEGKLVKQSSMNELYSTIASLNPNTLAYSPFVYLTRSIKKDSINYFVKYLRNISVDKQLQPFNVLQYGTPANLATMDTQKPYNFYYSGIKNKLLFTGNYNTNIYELSSSGIENTYTLVFPQANSLPVDSVANLPTVIEMQTYLKKNEEQIYNLRGLYSIGNSLYFETVMTSLMAKDRYFIYNIKTQDLVSLNRISPGMMSHYLPLLSYYGSIIGCDGKYIYSTVSSLDMFQAKEATALKKANYPPLIEEYFNTQDRKSNPVIVQLQPLGL
ncbi:MAG: 6-bladed beta-propeller [Pedobacter sp.]